MVWHRSGRRPWLVVAVVVVCAVVLLASPVAAKKRGKRSSKAKPTPAVDAAASPPSSCRSLGFVSSICSQATCNKLAEAIGSDDALVDECRSCCTRSTATVAAVTLRVSKQYLPRYSEVKQFVNKHADAIDDFDVEYRKGYPPQLVLVGHDDTEELVSIAAWKLDQINAFVRQKLGAA